MSTAPSSRPMRAGDQDRHEAILALSDHFAEGRLDQAEFDVRMASAAEATYLHELDPLFADLPARASGPGRAIGRRPESYPLRRARHGFPLVLLPFGLAVVVAIVLLSHGHALWLLLPLWWIGASSLRRRMWRHEAVARRTAMAAPELRRPSWRREDMA